MAVNERSFIRILPESTGDRIGFYHTWDIEYSGKTGSFAVGDVVVGSVSEMQAIVIKDTVDNAVSTSGVLSTILLPGFEDKTNTVGETLNLDGSPQATVVTGYCIYINATTLVGGNNPKNKQSIDTEGAAYTRFAEGSPQFDAFGKMQTSSAHKIADYVMSYDSLPNDFSDVATGAGSLSHSVFTRGVTLQCGITSGDSYQRTSDEYHIYQAGVSQLIEMTAASGDTGKANVDRRWGYYDDDNGVYFELSGTTLNVGLRSKSTGSVVNTVYAQADWNKDTLDGSLDSNNPSKININVSKDTIYWIDLQWLGAGSVRFGILSNGVRIVAHEIANSGNLDASYMSTASLPIRYEQINTGTAASTSEFKFFCSSIKTEGDFNPFKRAFTDNSVANVNSVNATPIFALRAAQTYLTYNNRSTIYPNSFSVYNTGAEPIMFEMYRGSTATAGAWVSHGVESTAEVNKTMTGFTGGKSRHSRVISPASSLDISFDAFTNNRRGIRRKADITEWIELVFCAKLLVAGTGGNVTIIANWDEVRD